MSKNYGILRYALCHEIILFEWLLTERQIYGLLTSCYCTVKLDIR